MWFWDLLKSDSLYFYFSRTKDKGNYLIISLKLAKVDSIISKNADYYTLAMFTEQIFIESLVCAK